MSTMSRLVVMTNDEAEASRKQLEEGVLKSELRSLTAIAGTGYQPPDSEPNFPGRKPIIVRFSVEIRCRILSLLEPAWLLQLERAGPEIALLLANPQGNKIWYDSIPPALLTEPEYFQNEHQIWKKMLLSGHGRRHPEFTPRHAPMAMMPDHYRHFNERSGRHFNVPRLEGHTVLAVVGGANLRHFGIRHPMSLAHYPVIHTAHHWRLRILALGGPFCPFISYRRELVARMQSNGRCFMCFEILTGAPSSHPSMRDWDMNWCQACLEKWTLIPARIQGVRGLGALIAGYGQSGTPGQEWIGRERPLNMPQWRPFVDGILRNQIGMDFATTEAKEKYWRQILKTKAWSKSPLENSCRNLRQELVCIAQDVWKGWIAEKHPKAVACTAFLETVNLSGVLFPLRFIDESKMYHPYDCNEQYPVDPVSALESPRAIQSRSAMWKTTQAMNMLQQFFLTHSNLPLDTSLARAADRFHIDRIKATFSADDVIR